MANVYVRVRELPDVLRSVLASVDYGAKDIAIETTESVRLFDAGGAGRQGFSVLVNLETGETRTVRGSWGGGNAYSPDNPVDHDDTPYKLPPGGAVVQGSTGYPRTCATILLHPANVAKVLPPAEPPLSPKALRILYAYNSIKAGDYRKAELRSCRATDEDVGELVTSGHLKRATNGATSITTKGKNALAAGGAPERSVRFDEAG